jgi:signal transduction histidine kinase/CheY-like chemotaxis protein
LAIPASRSTPRPGIKRKLARVSLLLLALTGVSALVGVASVQLNLAQKQRDALETQIKKTLISRGLSLTQSHAFMFRALVADTAVTEMQNTISRTVGEHEDVVYGLFVGDEGRTWAYCAPSSPCPPVTSVSAISVYETNRVLRELKLSAGLVSEEAVRETDLFGQHIIEFAEPVLLDDELVGVLRYGLTTKSVESAVAAARKSQEALVVRELSSFGLGFLVIVAFGVYFARRTAETITRPLSELTRAAERFARGERDVNVAVASGDELQVLGEAFNHMVSELEASHDKLETKNRELETEIEQRKRAQDERSELQSHLVQAQKMEAFGQLAGGVAHDFNNILAIIVGNSDLAGFIMDDERLSDELKRLNSEVRGAAERGANLTRQLLTFARRESENPRIIDVNETLRAFAKLIRRVLEESVELVILPSELPCRVRIDPGRFEQVLMNLCVNARDAMPGGGKISLATATLTLSEARGVTTGQLEPGSYVKISAHDSGSGIPREVVSRIFEPFFTTKAIGHGTGLGLAMVHSIVHAAGGAIDVQSGEGRGSTFDIFLPVVSSVDSNATAPQNDLLPRATGMRVLLCEDEPAVRAMTRRILERGGHAVEESASPERALELLHTQKFDLLLTDVVMPHMNGKELADQARLLAPDLTVLFGSGYAGGILTAHGIGDESLYFLRKPFQARELLERLRALAELRRAP